MREVRLVSHIWNVEALNLLRSLPWVTIFDSGNCEGGGDEVMRISEYGHSDLNFTHWRLKLPTSAGGSPSHPTELQRARMNEAKILEDLTWLMDMTHNVKSLVLIECAAGTE